jgi:hypothetical protein
MPLATGIIDKNQHQFSICLDEVLGTQGQAELGLHVELAVLKTR